LEHFQGSQQVRHRPGETIEAPDDEPVQSRCFSFVPEIPMSTYSARAHPRRSQNSPSSRVWTRGSWPLLAVLTRA
jgi:hypothetical protein